MLDTFKSRCASDQYEICFGNHASKFTLEEIDQIVMLDNKRSNSFVDIETLKAHLKELRIILGSGLVYKPPLHTKALIIDDEFMIIGSHNWMSNTGQGTDSKDEISCIITDKDMIDYVKGRYFSINNLKES
jgi:phosphatidylserine/phosphatidylglycerophosphate/cardiolipin synthase-like enzyme